MQGLMEGIHENSHLEKMTDIKVFVENSRVQTRMGWRIHGYGLEKLKVV